MWLYFNRNGQLIKSLEHGSPARVGTTAFQIFAVFENITSATLLDDFSATIKLVRPDLTGSGYPTLLMSNVRTGTPFALITENGETIQNVTPFQVGTTYYGFLFDFGDWNRDEQTEEVLLDTAGLWEATITIIKNDLYVQGVATFNVGGTGTDDAVELSYDVVTNQLMHEINQRALKSRVIITIASLEDGLSISSDYENGQLFFNEEDHKIYELIRTEGQEDELVDVGLLGIVVDNQLSNTSENPVQNKVVTEVLTNVEEIAEGKSKSFILSDLTIAPTTDEEAQALTKVDGTAFEDLADFTSYVDGAILLNSNFNNQNIAVSVTSGYLININKTVWLFNDILDIYKTGDLFLIIEVDVPDRWLGISTSDNVYTLTFYKLETTKVNLTDYVTLSTDQTITGEKTFIGTKTAYKYQDSSSTTWNIYSDEYSSFRIDNGNTKMLGIGSSDVSTRLLLPISNNTYDLGSSSRAWKDLYLSGKTYFDGTTNYIYKNNGTVLGSGGADVLRITSTKVMPASNSSIDLGDTSTTWKDLYLSGSIKDADGNSRITYSGGFLTFNANLISNSTGTRDIGTSYNTWKDLYLSGTAYLSTVEPASGTLYLGKSGQSVQTNGNLIPNGNNTRDLGGTNRYWKDLYLAGNLTDGVNFVTVADIGKVKTVNGATPDSSGNVQVSVSQTGFFRHTVGTKDGSTINTPSVILITNSSAQLTTTDLLNSAIGNSINSIIKFATIESPNVTSHTYPILTTVHASGSSITIKYLEDTGVAQTLTITSIIGDAVTTL